jgi:predicted DNA-binding transcriptional regulator YafY
MRSARLVSTLLLLQTRGRMTARQLADELEVSIRTVYRDIESLSASGVPVYADRGPAGGYQLLGGYRTRLTGLTQGEAESLVFTGMPDQAADLGLGTVLAAAQLKLQAALPAELRERADRIRERFHLDAPGWFRDAESVPYLAAVADAVWNQRRIAVRYRRWGNQEVNRTLAPLGLVLKAGSWYLIAAADSEPRTYRIGRILHCEVLEDSFERPADFDLGVFWQTRERHLHSSLYRGEARIRLSPHGMQMAFLLGAVVHRAARDNAEPEDDGWVRTTIPTESTQHALHSLLQLGPDVEVLEPAELRTAVAEAAHALAGVYPKPT